MTTLFNINEDCLYQIFKYVTIKDLHTISTMEEFQAISLRNFFVEKFSSDKFQLKSLNNHETMEMFVECVPRMRRVTIDFGDYDALPLFKCHIMKLITQLGRELEKVTLIGNFLQESVKEINVRKLKKFVIIRSNIKDKTLKSILKCNESLKHIVLWDCPQLKGEYMEDMKNLDCAQFIFVRINDRFAQMFVENNPDLRILDVVGTNSYSTKFLAAINKFKKLTTVEFTGVENLKKCLNLASLTTLRSVTIRSDYNDRDFMNTLANTNQIEHLEIDFEQPNNNNNDLTMLRKLTNLKSLAIDCLFIKEIPDISDLKKLEFLALYNSMHVDEMRLAKMVVDLPSLKVLNVKGCSRITEGSETIMEFLLTCLGRKLELQVGWNYLRKLTDKLSYSLSMLTIKATPPRTFVRR